MKRIIKITKSEKVKDRFYLDFDHGGSLCVGLNQIADYSLHTGRELTDEEFSRLSEDSEKNSAKARALRIAGSRAMSRSELTDRLVQKGEKQEVAEETAEWMESIGAVNDREYAGMIVRHYVSQGYGIAKIKNELYRRKIAKELWDDALSEMPVQDDAIDRLIKIKLRGKTPDKRELKRVSDSLLRRGFTWDEVKNALVRYDSNIEECD